jgi:hypothetical protein
MRETAASDMIFVERKTFGSSLPPLYFCMNSLGTQPLSEHYLTNYGTTKTASCCGC